MFLSVSVSLMILTILVPLLFLYRNKRDAKRFKRVLAVNLTTFFGVVLFATVIMFSKTAFAAEQVVETTDALKTVLASSNGMAFIAAALSTGLGSIGCGIATGSAASAALGALSENEGIMGKALIFVGLAEGIAIYGFVISFLILNNVVS